MTEPKDPPRWLDAEGAAPEGLRRALQGAEQDVGSELAVERLAQRLSPLFAAPPVVPAPVSPPAAPAPAPALGLSAGAKLGLGALALVGAGAAYWALSAGPRSGPERPAAPAAPSSSLVAAPVVSASPSRAPEQVAGDPAPRPGPVASAAPEGTEPVLAPAPKGGAQSRLSEAELLEQARGALSGNPARALERANQHAARYPGGVLVQEREVIAIEALRRLGRAGEAERRAAAFAKAFPGSAYQRKLERSP